MSKYMSQLYNKRKTLENKIFDRSKVKKSEEVDSCHNKVPKENNNLKLKDGVPENIIDGSQSSSWCSLSCRSIRIGNYKVLPKEKITITEKGIQIIVPGIMNPNDVITINIFMKDVLKVLGHFGKQMPLLFLYISPAACQKTRKLLKMANSQGFFLDVQSPDETQKRITILPEKLNEESKVILKQHFAANLQELESKDANEILVRSSPKDIQKIKEKMMGQVVVQDKRGPGTGSDQPGPVVKYCQYPPDMAGNVSVTNEDYNCLEAEQFLNDVIIDFYLKYLQHGKFTNIKEVMERTHMFTTYFYNRLTTRPRIVKGKTHPVEDNPSLSAAEKRYERVERWTKKVNLFDKDFIVVPINEHAHWFVCVICFPGQIGCVNADTGEPCEPPPSQFRNRGARGMKRKTVKKPMTIGSTTITRVIPGSNGREDIKFLEEDGSDRDEAEASEDEMDEDEEEPGAKKPEDPVAAKLAIRQPCIIVFDSLAGSSKARTIQTLREYLTCEWKRKMVSQGKEARVFTKENMPGGSPKVQQQPNFSDCGIYLLQYVESFFRDPIKDYTLPIKTLTQWFTNEEVENKRDNIATLIRELAATQNPNKEFSYPQLNFFNPPGEESDDDDDEDYDDGMRGSGRQPNVQITNGQVIRVSSGSPVVMTPSKGKVLIQKTGNQFKMSPYTSATPVPAGVTVTPAPGPPIRTLSANNISIRKMNVVSSGDSVQTSPDSTSQEPDTMDTSSGGGQGDQGETPDSAPDSQTGAEVAPGIKRTAEINGCDTGVKRIKSDTES